jgi:hypothetical protein
MFWNAGINLVTAKDKLIFRTSPRSAQYLMAPVDFKVNPSGELAFDGKVTETPPYLERIFTDTKELEEE